jgi:negative regulator of replication initiation
MPHYAMPLMVEVAVRVRDLVSTVGELLTSGNWSQESLASVERLLENLSLHVADLLSTSAQEGLMGLRREIRELLKSGAHPEVDGVLAEMERLLSSLIRINALIVAGT